MLLTVSFGTANTGEDVYYRILNPDKSVFSARTNTGVTELVASSGVYGVEIADVTIIGKTIVWDIDGTSKTASETIYTSEVDVSQINWTDLWGTMPTGTNVNVIAPVYTSGNIEIVRGDDYATPESRQLEWTDPNGIWPDLTGVGITYMLTIYRQGEIELQTAAVAYDIANTKLVAQLSSTDTESLTVGRSQFDIQATFPSGRIATLILGTATVVRDYTV